MIAILPRRLCLAVFLSSAFVFGAQAQSNDICQREIDRMVEAYNSSLGTTNRIMVKYSAASGDSRQRLQRQYCEEIKTVLSHGTALYTYLENNKAFCIVPDDMLARIQGYVDSASQFDAAMCAPEGIHTR